MMTHVKKWLLDIFSEDDGESICVAKVLAVLAFLSYLGYAGFGLYKAAGFSIHDFAEGLMTVLLGSGGVIASKQITQRKQE